MKYTVFYKPDGTVISTVSEQDNIKNIKIGTFEVEDGHIIDSIDVSNDEHPVAVSHATPMASSAELEALKKQAEFNKKQAELNATSIAELTDLVMNSGSK